MTSALTAPPQSICLLRLSAIGDVCHAVAVLRALQRAWPDAKITWIIGKLEARLVGDIAGVEFLVYDKKSGRAGLAELKQRLRGRRYDVLLHLNASMRANRIARLVTAPIKLGYDRRRARDWQWLFTNRRIPAVDGQHVQEAMLSFAASLGVTDLSVDWQIPLSEADQAYAKEQIAEGERCLVISPCSSHPLRNWHAAGYAAVADYAVEKHGLNVLLCGGPSELECDMGAAIMAAMRQPAKNLIGQDTLKQFLATLARATLLISPDSGPMHMARTVATPVIGLHAASNPLRSGPYGNAAYCVNQYPQAAKQFLGKTVEQLRWGKKIEHEGVMDLITVAQVTEKIDRVLSAEAA